MTEKKTDVLNFDSTPAYRQRSTTQSGQSPDKSQAARRPRVSQSPELGMRPGRTTAPDAAAHRAKGSNHECRCGVGKRSVVADGGRASGPSATTLHVSSHLPIVLLFDASVLARCDARDGCWESRLRSEQRELAVKQFADRPRPSPRSAPRQAAGSSSRSQQVRSWLSPPAAQGDSFPSLSQCSSDLHQ